MSYKRLKHEYRLNASKLHKRVGHLLRSHPIFRGFRIYQEWPIPESPYFVDWFIFDLGIAIEVQGEQHSNAVAFDGNKEAALERLIEQIHKDRKKRELCQRVGWKLVELWYDEEKSDDYIANKILQSLGADYEQETQ